MILFDGNHRVTPSFIRGFGPASGWSGSARQMHGVAWLEWFPRNHFSQVILCTNSNLILSMFPATIAARGVPTDAARNRFTSPPIVVENDFDSNH
ncbi:hypothetical protein RB3660 [Rhodopirellula baltica SH 1]|uniref:Uncharacterized protein n=1 Tax=Rhodopirellula baltica (strain DSM 10527 / NCIMB 13988 / SH1) TaxID=243090 RepID=Q7UTV6_RHOBA|nr:hypothetical protein RB3660 [Rhodopirellula baltica SH 1]